MKRIPVCEPLLGGNELAYVEEALKSGWISSSGTFVERLERDFANYLGVPHAIACTSGTAALHLACLAADIGPGDEVIVPDFTMVASAFAVCYTGATPVFVDCEPETFCIDPRLIEAKIGPRTKAIMPVHIYGHPCDMPAIRELAARHGLLVIEDAAEALGAEVQGQKCGALSDLACFSLFANKLVTSGEGGLVVTRDARLAERCRYFKNLCFPLQGPRSYVHDDIGFNYRLPNTLAAIAVAQLERVHELLTLRRQNAARYRQALDGITGLSLQPERPWAKNAYWMVALLVDEAYGLERDGLMNALGERGIETRRFFVGMHAQPALRKYGCDVSGAYPVSEDLARRGLYLPSSSGLLASDIDYIAETLRALRR